MTELVALLTEARKTGNWDLLIDAIPYTRFMGIGAEVVDGELHGKLSYSEMLIGNSILPALHGGTLGALLESTAIFEVLWKSETIVLPKTISITIEFLRAGKPVDTFARATITRRGRRVATVRAEAWQEDRDRPIAVANGNVLIMSLDDVD